MKRLLVIAPLLMGFVKAPAGWRADDNEAKAIAAKANTLPHFGGAAAVATTQVLLASDGPGALYVTAIAGKVGEHRDAAARVEIDSFLATGKRAQLMSTNVSTGRTSSSVNAAKQQLEIELEWSDVDTQTQARLIIAADAENMIAVTGECVFAASTTEASRKACEQALKTLDPGIAADKRVVLALAPDGTEPPATEKPSPTIPRLPSTMSDGSRTPLPPMNIPTETKRTTDRRPVYVGLGIVLLAAVFWWNRRRRERFDAEGPNDDDKR